ncbi:MAG: hypothetical protein LBG96_13160 [Tannerella sp.]|jgi:hypothetical protein|nr:hypothetical protein [Tannerella sp.]
MKTKRLLFIVIGVLMMLFPHCTHITTYNREITKKIEVLLKNDAWNYESVVIIPGSGCTGCISVAEKFFLDNVSNEKIKFILTKNASQKGLVLRLHEENLKRENVLIDVDNNFYLIGYEEKIYPVIVFIEKKKVIQIRRLSS